MKLSCSRCGADYEFHYCAANVLNAVYNLGWNSCGAVLYCPECSATWDEHNKGRPLAGPESTISLIDEIHRKSRRRRALI